MSYTEIYRFDNKGNGCFERGIKNSFRGAMAVWRILEERYLPQYRPSYIPAHISDDEIEGFCGFIPTRCTSLGDSMQEIWDLVDKDIPVAEKIVLYMTFDKCLVRKEDLKQVIVAFKNFEGDTSLKEQAEVLEEMLNDSNCIAIGWNQTSVNGDTWESYGYDEEKDEEIPYNCLKQNEHFWLFDYIGW